LDQLSSRPTSKPCPPPLRRDGAGGGVATERERTVVSKLFESGAVQVLVTSYRHCWGIEPTAHCVIIVGTRRGPRPPKTLRGPGRMVVHSTVWRLGWPCGW